MGCFIKIHKKCMKIYSNTFTLSQTHVLFEIKDLIFLDSIRRVIL